MGGASDRVTVERDRLAVTSVKLAPRLLGAVLVSEVGGARVAVRLTEVEAYEGTDDPASHGFRGPTPRTAVMFGPAGFLYCYFTYGMHWCANVVCGAEGRSSAVLMRAGEIVEGADVVAVRRATAKRTVDYARGPARLATCLALDAATDGLDLCSPASPVRLEYVPPRARPGALSGPRVGISAAAERPWRFWLPNEPTVSAFKAGGRKRLSPARQTEQP